MGEHTKGPWRTEGDGIVSPSGERIATVWALESDTAASEQGRHWGSFESDANAAHIVRCVNAHDALVEALEALLRDCDNTKGIIHPKGHPGYLQARTALALARGE